MGGRNRAAQPEERVAGVTGVRSSRLRSATCASIVGALAFATAACSGAPPPATGPNVLLIVVDTLRADYLSQYGYELPTGTALDEFAGEATRFTRAHSVSPRTGPSTASIFSGLAPDTHLVRDTGDLLSDGIDTLAERLARAGYSTAGFSDNVVISGTTGFGQGFGHFRDYDGGVRVYPDVADMIDEASAWLARPRDGAFFLYMHPMNVHGPYLVPEAHASELLGRPPGDEFKFYGPLMRGLMNRGMLALRDDMTSEMRTSLEEQYAVAVRYTCDQLARILDRLRQADLYDDTLIIVTADHGEELFEHGGFGHAYTLHREALHVPLLVKLPHQSDARTADGLASSMDVLPTVLDVLGLDAAPDAHGRSLAPLLTGTTTAETRTALYAQEISTRTSAWSLLTDDFRLIQIDLDYAGRTGRQLFNVRDDPLEMHDLAGERADVVERLSAELEARRTLYRGTQPADATSEREELDADVLRGLGYAE